MTCSAAWKCVSLMFCPAIGHCPDPDDGRAAAVPDWAMSPVIATAMVTVPTPMSAARALVSLRNIRFNVFSLVGWLASVCGTLPA
jgi:hypothetical protein